MKIIFFNIYDGVLQPEGIKNFLSHNKESTDIFCFQDYFKHLPGLLNEVIPDYTYASAYHYINEPEEFGLATYISPKYAFLDSKDLTKLYLHLAPLLYSKIQDKASQNVWHIYNIHGLSRPVDKLDSPERIEYFNILIEHAKKHSEKVVLGGDFNLLPSTKCISNIEDEGFLNLIKDFNITSTRNEVVWRKFPTNKMYYSDYIFVSKDLKAKSFEVPYNELSDHLPLILKLA